MIFKEYLISTGVSEEQATSIVEGMPMNKFYLATEEKLDERYAKVRSQKEQLETQLFANQTELDTLKESAKGNEELTTQLTELQAKFDESKTESESKFVAQQKDFAIQLALKESNPLDESIVLGLLDKETIKVADTGLQGFKEQLEGLMESKPFLFTPSEEGTPPPIITIGGNAKGGNGNKVDAFQAAASKFI